jgi:hypothetical protein
MKQIIIDSEKKASCPSTKDNLQQPKPIREMSKLEEVLWFGAILGTPIAIIVVLGIIISVL